MTLLITTGGTIDSHRDAKQQMIAPLRHTIVPDTVRSLGLQYVEHRALCAKDARDLDRHDSAKLVSIVEQTDQQHIVITHGYQTMVDTMKMLQDISGAKSIVLVGSLLPLSEPASDGLANLTGARSWTEPGIRAIRNQQPITMDELHELLYQGKVVSEWCL